MRNTCYLVGLLALTSLVGCQDDVSSNRKTAEADPNVTAITPTPAPETSTQENRTLRSNVHRDRGAQILSLSQEISQSVTGNLSSTLYRVIPLMEKDDEGSAVNVITVSKAGRPKVACGLSLSGINARISECASLNTGAATWDGTVYGASGEGTWKLVSLTSTGQETWHDSRTGLVWSDIVTTKTGVNVFNWCKASGNDQNATKTELIDCNDLNAGESVCVGASFDGSETQVTWRLPTRNDFLQADLNGARFVLKKESDRGLWTATLKSDVTGRNEAWVYNSQFGTLSPGLLSTDRNVRCVGAPVL